MLMVHGILLDRNEWRKLIHVPDLAYFSFDSCSLPQIRGTNGLVVVVVVVVHRCLWLDDEC